MNRLVLGLVIITAAAVIAAVWCGPDPARPAADAGPPPSPTPEAGPVGVLTQAEVDLLGALSRVEVEAVLGEGRAALRACYASALEGAPTLGGSLTLSLMIGADGGVSSAFVAGSSLRHDAVEECFSDAAETWRFPPSRSGVTRLLIPFSLEPAARR